MTDHLPDGVYVDLPFDEYLSCPRLSASGIKDMLVSPGTFWARSWMNPDRVQDEKKHQIIGRAYHARILEPQAFMADYGREIVAEDFDDCIANDTEVKAFLRDAGMTQVIKGETSLQRAYRLRDAGCINPILAIERDVQWSVSAGRTLLSPRDWAEINRDGERLDRLPEIRSVIDAGIAEVSVLWTCPTHNIPLKCRFDLLSKDGFLDLKTFDNARGARMEDAITSAVRYNRIFVQLAFYAQAFAAIRTQDLEVSGANELLRKIREGRDPAIAKLLFLEKGGVPNILLYNWRARDLHPGTAAGAPSYEMLADATTRYGNPSLLSAKADILIDFAKRQFTNYTELHGSNPWTPAVAVRELTDDDFNTNWLLGDW